MALATPFKAGRRNFWAPAFACSFALVLAASGPSTWAAGSKPNPKSLLISVRYGEGDADGNTFISSRENQSEQRVQVLEGERASIAVVDGPGGRGNQTGARAATQSMLEVVAKVSGDIAVVQIFYLTQSQSSSSSQGNRVATSLRLPLGAWTEVSGRGPWSGSDTSSISSASARGNNNRVFIKVEDLGH